MCVCTVYNTLYKKCPKSFYFYSFATFIMNIILKFIFSQIKKKKKKNALKRRHCCTDAIIQRKRTTAANAQNLPPRVFISRSKLFKTYPIESLRLIEVIESKCSCVTMAPQNLCVNRKSEKRHRERQREKVPVPGKDLNNIYKYFGGRRAKCKNATK